MASRLYRGDSVPVAQVTKITPANVLVGDTFTITCNGKSVVYVALAATVADVVAGLIAALSASTIPEFSEVLASAASDNSYLTLTAATPGVPFTITTSSAVTTAGQITVVETTKGVAPVNEVHQINLVGTYTGGTFTITYSFGTTGAIAYNAPASAVQTALAALAGVGAGQVLVTGGPGPNSPWFVTWTGTLGGQAIAVGTINGASLTGNGGVTITEATKGQGPSNCIQQLDFSNGGWNGNMNAQSFTLSLDGQTTSVLNAQATAAQIQTALQALPNIGSGNCTVYAQANGSNNGTPTTGGGFILFTGAMAQISVNKLVVGGWTGSGAAPTVTILQQGGAASADEFQFIDAGTTSNNYRLTFSGQTTIALNPGVAQAGSIQSALQALSSIGANNVTVYGQFSLPLASGCPGFLVRFTGALANTRQPLITFSAAYNTGQAITRVELGQANTNEVWNVYVTATGGTFTLTLGAQTTSALAWNIATGTLQTRIQTDLSAGVTACTVSGSGTVAAPWVITVTNPANSPVGPPTGNGTSLTGGGGTIVEVTHGAAGVNEVQTITEAAGINGGTFTLAFNGAVTGPQAWNVAAATTLQTALRGLVTINGANVTVSGSAGGPYTVTFIGTLAATDVPMLVGDGSLLTGATGSQSLAATTTTFSAGPHHYDDPLNWTGTRIPDSGDAEFFEEGSSDCLYGLNQIATFTANAGTDVCTWTGPCDLHTDQIVNLTTTNTLPAGLAAATAYYLVNVDRNAGTCQLAATSGGAAIDITTTGTGTHTMGVRLASFEHNTKYTGAIGLSKLNGLGYYEYRPLYLHIGLQAAGAKTVTIGTGQGSGSGKIQIDTDVDQASVKVIQTGGSAESGIPALLWKGTHASNTLNLIDGNMAVALYAGETTALASLSQRGGTLELGTGVTLTGPIDKTGGTLFCDSGILNGAALMR